MSAAPTTLRPAVAAPSTDVPGARATTRRSSLVVGTVRHRRRRPTRTDFRYDVFHALLDVEELPALDRVLPGFGHDRPAPVGFRDRDHLDARDRPARQALAELLATRGVTLPTGPVLVWCNLRIAGHVFDPVSWWFCHHPDGTLAFVVAEVHSTFGDGYAYLLDDLERGRDGLLRAEAPKVLHVSPFLPTTGLRYRFVLRPPTPDRPTTPQQLLAHVEVRDEHGVVLDATQQGRRVALTGRNLARALRRYPLVTVATVVRIHLQALRVWARGVRFHPRPTPPPGAVPAVAARGAIPATRVVEPVSPSGAVAPAPPSVQEPDA